MEATRSVFVPREGIPSEDGEVYCLPMNAVLKNFFFWMLAALVIFLFWSLSSRIQKNERQLAFSEFVAQVDREQVKRVTVTGSSAGSQIVGEFKNGQTFRTFAPPQAGNLVHRMLEKGVEVTARDANSSSWLGHVISWTPIFIMIAFLVFFMRQMQSAPPVTRAERGLRAKSQIYELLSRRGEALSESEMFAELTGEKETELRIVLYEMLRDGTVVFTTERKYRAKMVD
jgi:ATP-dependent Zn protease